MPRCAPFWNPRPPVRILLCALLMGAWCGTASAQVVTQPAPGMPQTRTGPRDPTTARETGTGRISGRVVGGDTGAPLRRAMVVLFGEGLREGRATSTDENGRYEIKDLPPGRFSLQANKASYVSLGYGQRRPNQRGKQVELGDGQALDGIDFNLPRGGVIAGRIVDEFGEPVAGLDVQVLRYAYREGRRQLVPVGGWGRQTDDRGQYRVYGLPPGEYYVTARLGRGGMGSPQSDSRTAFGTTFYPGVPNAAEAQRVTVSAGGEQASINFAVVPVSTVRVSGTVIDSRGRPVTQGMIVVQSGRDEGLFAMSGGMIKPDGTFTVNNLSPGEYVFHVTTANGPGDDDSEFAILPLAIASDDQTGIAITTTPPSAITGQLVFETQPAGTLRPAQFSLIARAVDPQSPMFGRMSPVRDDWTFEVRVMEGPVLIRQAAFPDGWRVKAVMLNGMDVIDTGIPLRPGQPVEGIQVIVTNRSSSITGTVTGERGTPAREYTVVIFPNDADRWIPASRFFRTAGPDQQGRFEARMLPPGDYLVLAVDAIEDGQQTDPEFLQQMRASATPVQLNDVETRPVTLRLVSTTR